MSYDTQVERKLTEFSRADDKLHRSLEEITIHDFGLRVLFLELIKLLIELPVVVVGKAVVPPKAPSAGIVIRFFASVVQRQVQWEATDWEDARHQQVGSSKFD
jgi:hypothetical protein